jgi:DNA mismatch repair protein MutL
MADIIKLLPDHVASQIAAGEVVQRPSSLVKELLDNAIDAKSTSVKLLVKEGGKALVQVIDNGCGMSHGDARMCWERHATSKIGLTEDIFRIKTMGFRGEALASIASVARVEMKTKRDEDEFGTSIVIEGSKVISQEDIAADTGTSIAVKNLFYNIPARRNFLKSNPVEYKHVLDEFIRCVLANPEIKFALYHNDEEQFLLEPSDLEGRITDVFSGTKKSELISIEEETSIIDIKGFCGLPESAKKARGEQFFFVNKRFIKDPYLNHAIVGAYEGLISKEQFPLYVLHISIDPSQIDVNIHPTKTEIKFEDEKNIYQILRAVVRKALGGILNSPEMNIGFDDNRFMHHELGKNPGFESENSTVSTASRSQRNSWDDLKFEYSQKRNQVNQNWETLFPDKPKTEMQSEPETVRTSSVESELAVSRNFFQLHQTYIVTQIKRGLMLVDQQAAHERILYEKYLRALDKNPVASQQLLFPKTVVLSAGDEQIMLEILDDIRLLGFNISHFGKNTFVVNGLPAELHLSNEQDLLEEVVETYKNAKTTENHKKQLVAKTLAIKAAIKRGIRLQAEEMNRLIDELFACQEPSFAPDGRACLKMLGLDELAKMFESK